MATRKKSGKRKKIRLPDVLSERELSELLNAPSVRSMIGIRNRCVLSLMGKNGLRVSEVCQLKVKDIRLAADDPYVRIIGKGDKERRGFLGNGSVEMLREWIQVRPKRGDYLFPVIQRGRRTFGTAKAGRPISRRAVAYMVEHFAKKIELGRRIHPHTLRHTAGTLAMRAGYSIRKVQKMLGHAVISATGIYTHVTDNEMSDMARRLDPDGKDPR